MQLNQFIESEKCHMFDCLRDIVSANSLLNDLINQLD
jgi:hypothetical protein